MQASSTEQDLYLSYLAFRMGIWRWAGELLDGRISSQKPQSLRGSWTLSLVTRALIRTFLAAVSSETPLAATMVIITKEAPHPATQKTLTRNLFRLRTF